MDPITAFIVNLVISLALSAGAALIQSARSQKTQVRGFRGATQTGGTVPLSFLVGTIGVPGKLEYTGTWGNSGETPNAYLVDLLSLGDLPITAVTGLVLNSVPVSIADSGHVSQGYPVTISLPTGPDSSHLWVEHFDGWQSSAPSYLTTAFGSDPERPWLSDMIGTGVPMLALTALVSDEVWTGFPAYLVEAQGIPLYDPRQDSTAGGSGSQRWANPSTWAFTDNPIVIVYNILRGIHDSSLTVTTLGPRLWGGEATAYQLPYAEWAAAMDACDAPIDLVGGGTEKRFRAGREIFVNERPADVIGELLAGANARLSPAANGQYHVIVGVPEAATGSFTDADVIITETTRFEPFPALDQIVNGATGTYMEPAQAWELKETAPYYRSDLEAEDDGRRQLEGLSFPTTFSGTQAQRLLKAIVEDSRRFRRHVVPLPPVFAVYKVLDVLAWTSTENGYAAKLFLITHRTLDPFGNVILALQEIDPADYDWTPETDEQPLTFAPVAPIRPPAQDLTGWSAAPFVDLDSTGTGRRFGIEVTTPAYQPDVRAVRIQVWEDFGDEELKFDSDEWPYDVTEDAPRFRVSGPFLLPGHDYKVRGKFVPPDGSGRVVNWTDWLEVTTPDIGIGFADLGAEIEALEDWMGSGGAAIPALIDEVAERTAAVGIVAGGVRDLLDSSLAQALLINEQDAQNALQVHHLREEVRLAEANAEAYIVEQVDLLVGPGSAIAQQIEELGAAAEDNTAAIGEEAIARADGDAAEAAQRELLEVQLRGSYTGTDIDLVTTGLIYQMRLAQLEGDQALLEQVEAIAISGLESFDSAGEDASWYFDSSVEGWTGNGAPSFTDGWLRPANHASDAYVVSPASLAVSGVTYGQVRLRIRKTGAPTWGGQLWWKAPGDGTWDAGRRVTLDEPSYTDGVGYISVNAGWAVTIDQIRIDLSTAADDSNFFEIDWIAIGRPAPGASLAAVQAMGARLTITEDDLDALTTLTEGIETELANKADVSVTDAQAARITTAEGAIAVLGQATNRVRSELLLPMALEAGEIAARNALAVVQARKALALVDTSYQTAVRETNAGLDLVAAAVTQAQTELDILEGEVATKASSTVVNALTSRTSDLEGTVTTQGDAITAALATVGSVSAEFAFKATAFASPGGGWSNIGLQAAASNGNVPSTASIFLQATTAGASRVVLKGSETVIVDASNNIAALFNSDGATFQAARIADASIANAKIINLNGTKIDNGTLATAKAAANAWTHSSIFIQSPNPRRMTSSPSSVSTTTIVSGTHTPVGGTVLLRASGLVYTPVNDSNAWGACEVYLLVNGTPVKGQNVFYDEDGASRFRDGNFFMQHRIASAGTSGLALELTFALVSGAGAECWVRDWTIVAENFKDQT